MLTRIFSRLLFFVPVILILLLAGILLLLHTFEYAECLEYIVSLTGRPELYDEISSRFFTLSKYHLLKKLLLNILFLLLPFLILYLRYYSWILILVSAFIQVVLDHAKRFVAVIRASSRETRWMLSFLLVLIVLRSCWYAGTIPLQHDEAWNYNSFLKKNVVFSVFYYNNYPLHNLLSWAWMKMFPLTVFVLRVPSILAGLLACLVVFVTAKKFFRYEWIALLAVLIFACLPVSFFYMFYARGVMFEMLFIPLLIYIVLRNLQREFSMREALLAGILNALATYSMLSHFYFMAMSVVVLVAGLILLKQKSLKFVLYYSAYSFLFSFILISPFLTGSGISPGTEAMRSGFNFLSLHELPYHCYSTFMSGFFFVFYLCILLNAWFFFYFKNIEFRFLNMLNLASLILPLLIHAITNTYPPERALAFLFFTPLSTMLMVAYMVREYQKVLIPTLLFIAGSMQVMAHKSSFLNWSILPDKEAQRISALLMDREVDKLHFTSARFQYFIPAIEFYYARQGRRLQLSSSIPASSRYTTSAPVDADVWVTDQVPAGTQSFYALEGFFIYPAASADR